MVNENKQESGKTHACSNQAQYCEVAPKIISSLVGKVFRIFLPLWLAKSFEFSLQQWQIRRPNQRIFTCKQHLQTALNTLKKPLFCRTCFPCLAGWRLILWTQKPQRAQLRRSKDHPVVLCGSNTGMCVCVLLVP